MVSSLCYFFIFFIPLLRLPVRRKPSAVTASRFGRRVRWEYEMRKTRRCLVLKKTVKPKPPFSGIAFFFVSLFIRYFKGCVSVFRNVPRSEIPTLQTIFLVIGLNIRKEIKWGPKITFLQLHRLSTRAGTQISILTCFFLKIPYSTHYPSLRFCSKDHI